MSDMHVATTILKQLGGKKFIAMTGANTFVDCGNGVTMKIGRNKSRSTHLNITLNAMDTYDFKFLMVKGDKQVITEYNGIYNDMLAETFTEHTGLYTSL